MYNGLGARKKIVVLEHFNRREHQFQAGRMKQMEDGGDNSGRSPYPNKEGQMGLLFALQPCCLYRHNKV